MEHNSIHKTIVGVAASALAFGALWIHRIKSRKQISRQCQVNRDDERENYINSILYTAGWEGSAHDSRILTDAFARPRGFSIPEGKYYLADAGYGIRNGIISPYRGVRYHLKELSNHRPENAKELFNLRHSSLRTTVERVFGILKKRFRVLDAEPFWDFQTQIDVVLACTIIHNHIMGVDPNDIINEGMYEELEPYSITSILTQREEREEAREWASKRDEIAEAM
ncbi:uncharacterized protein LOC120208686 [Hibiscus syriacus]|uniref:uncharacterized protein LOC120208686 n=1 Tax=Hibiscus syriacus TaxID=106335 RepID=UPI0019241AB5|nr:uncharacterized protein LOC120208686 [Hibiscus syriacus]